MSLNISRRIIDCRLCSGCCNIVGVWSSPARFLWNSRRMWICSWLAFSFRIMNLWMLASHRWKIEWPFLIVGFLIVLCVICLIDFIFIATIFVVFTSIFVINFIELFCSIFILFTTILYYYLTTFYFWLFTITINQINHWTYCF